MVIVTNYELIENTQTGFFMFGVQNLSLVLVVETLSKFSAAVNARVKKQMSKKKF